jgi:GntR family transcriptional repressor for pyruvate dehydrogenase complex
VSEPSAPSRPSSGDVRLPKVAELVAGEIRRRIISGDVNAGDPLPNEAELTALFGVSRPTLREALRLLESDGLIEVKRGVRGGPRVRVPDVGVTARHAALLLQMRGTTLEDLIGARLIVEPAAVRELARRASKADVKALREAHQTELDAGDDYDANAHHATLFHALLVQLVGNQTLALLNELLTGIQDLENRTVVDRLSADEARSVVAKARREHEQVIDLIEQGDAAGAEAAWTRHLTGTVALTRRTFGQARLIDLRAID